MVSYKPTRKNINIEKILFDEELSKMTTLRHDRDHIPKPLLNLLPEFYKNFNVTDILPFFTDDHPLRFFKLFSSIYHQEYHPKYHNFITDKPADIRFYLSQNDIPEALKVILILGITYDKKSLNFFIKILDIIKLGNLQFNAILYSNQ